VQEKERKRKAQEAEQNQQAKKIALASNERPSRSRQDTNNSSVNAFPSQMSLYDAMMTPSLGGGLFESFSPRVNDSYPDFPTGTSSLNGLAPSVHIMSDMSSRPGFIQTALAHAGSNSLSHPSSPVSSARDTPILGKQTSPLGKTNLSPNQRNHVSLQPLSTRDPNFAGSATEFVNAATALTSLTQGPSEVSIPGPSRITPPPSSAKSDAVKSSPKQGSGGRPRSRTTPAGEQDAAELMLYLAQSPSPGPAKRRFSNTMLAADDSDGMKGRQLFAPLDGDANGGLQAHLQANSSLQPAQLPQSSSHSQIPPAPPSAPLTYNMPMNGSTFGWQQSHYPQMNGYGGLQPPASLMHHNPLSYDLPTRSQTPPNYRPHSPFDVNAFLNVSPGRSSLSAPGNTHFAMPSSSSYGQMW